MLGDVLNANKHILDALQSRTAKSDRVFFDHCSTLLRLLDQGPIVAQRVNVKSGVRAS